MTKSKKIRNGPDLGKYIRKKHRYATYLDASRLFSIPYYSLIRMAKEANAFSREMIMKEYIDMVRQKYDFIIIDCMPSLGMMTINALASSDSVLVPIITAYLSVKGLEQLTL